MIFSEELVVFIWRSCKAIHPKTHVRQKVELPCKGFVSTAVGAAAIVEAIRECDAKHTAGVACNPFTQVKTNTIHSTSASRKIVFARKPPSRLKDKAKKIMETKVQESERARARARARVCG